MEKKILKSILTQFCSTLSNRLVAVSQTEVIETLSGGDDLPGEINSVGHQHYREYHHHDIYHDVHCDALFHYRVHNITAFHCFFPWVNTSQGRNLIRVSSTVFLQADITELWRRVWEISFYLLKHFCWPLPADGDIWGLHCCWQSSSGLVFPACNLAGSCNSLIKHLFSSI